MPSSQDEGFSVALISVRIVHIDHYTHNLQTYSTSLPFQAARLTHTTSAQKLPVIRIFGATPAGQSCCVHLHGLRPYLYLPLPLTIAPSETFSYTARLRVALEFALKSAFMAEVQDQSNLDNEFVADIEPVLKRDIYGYHPHQRIFLKVHTFAPRTITRIATIVAQRGLPEELVPQDTACYAAHIPFVMQTLVDHGLAGMAYINFSSVRFRRPLPDGSDAGELFARPNGDRKFVKGLEELKPELFWPFQVTKRSTSELEIDVFAEDVLNGGQMEGEHAFVSRTLAVLWEEERLRTGAYPPRQISIERHVKAGGHLSESELRERLEQVMAVGTRDASQVLEENAASLLASQRDVGSASFPESYDDVLNVLDASAPYADVEEDVCIEEFEDEVDEILDPDFGGDAAAAPVNRRCKDDELGVEKTWADIAACTQKKPVSPKVGNELSENDVYWSKRQRVNLPQESDSSFRGSISTDEVDDDFEHIASDHRLTKEQPTLQVRREVDLVPKRDAEVLEDGQWFVEPRSGFFKNVVGQESASTPLAVQQLTDPVTIYDENARGGAESDLNDICHNFVRPRAMPPLRSTIMLEPGIGNALAITYTTPFYGDKEDEVQSRRAFGGLIIPVRESGAAGYPPFPTFFDNMKTEVEILPRVVRPSETPPLISQLKRGLIDASNLSGNSAKQGKHVIDSAGRQVYQHGTGTTCDSQIFSFDPAVNFMPQIVKVRNPSTVCDEGSDSSEVDEFLTTTEKVSQPKSTQTDDTLVQNRPLSPKYDEGFQRYILPNQASETPRRKTPQSAMRQSTDTDSILFNRNSTVSLSESMHRYQNLTVMSVEILAACYINKLPDPNQNSILAICAVTQKDRKDNANRKCSSVVFALDTGTFPKGIGLAMLSFESEVRLLDAFGRHVRQEDPDIIVGYETQNTSIGFILERAQVITHPFAQAASRWITKSSGGGFDSSTRTGGQNANAAATAYYHRKGADIKITGRHVLSLWRIVRKEVKLPSYSRETVAAELFETTFSKHAPEDLENWLNSRKDSNRAVRYLVRISSLNVAILDKLNILGRTGELARVFGVDFMDVIIRGSQFRVESMLGRVALTRDFLLLSAAREEVFQQPAVEALPLVMEPQSALYVDPVIVLDFQSLYPSVIIAHNLCYTTMLGNLNRIGSWSEPRRIGVVPRYVPTTDENGKQIPMENIFVSSSGEMFVDASVRKGILPQLLREILETRVMVKRAMKGIVGDGATLGLLNARQFGLKMIANVTYGYTAASFSGRMPCSGLADAIVQCGRDSLEEVVRYVEEELRQETGATVVYGDTDSLFVKVPGATREEAFSIGERIVNRACQLFPDPITLKLEKVYQPSIMQTKKRYVGYSYESRDQVVPIFDAKGIETVRRDSCPLVQKALEKSIRLLFETKNISTVKKYIQRLCHKLHLDRIPLVDYIFRKEVRLGSYKEGHLPPAAIVATKAMERDPRTTPRHGERVPFVVIYDRPGAPLKDCVVSPADYLSAASLGQARLNTTYYITKQILPTLDRVFSLVGVNVMSWYSEIPRPLFDPIFPDMLKKRTRNIQSSIRMFYTVEKCYICHGKAVRQQVCTSCLCTTPEIQASYYLLAMRAREQESQITELSRTCASCTGVLDAKCINLSCAVYDQLGVARRKYAALRLVLDDEHPWK